MPWLKTEAVDERLKFVAAMLKGGCTVAELCAAFGISRKTGYKIMARYASEGPSGLRDRRRAPLTHPNQTSPEIEAAVLRVRKAHPRWGSKKILVVLEREAPTLRLPARSTVEAIMNRAGVVRPRRRRGRPKVAKPAPAVDANAPNDVWSADYKGWFRLGDKTRCDPLTINDVYSRYSLRCQALNSPKLEDVREVFKSAFLEYGLPLAMLTDNGPPFGSSGLGGLTRLSVWLLRLGVMPVFIQPGKPQQNGRHERFHGTLGKETATPPKSTRPAQQRAFTLFQAEYNHERPHEALEMRTPAEVYAPSPRQMPRKLPEHEYPEDFAVRHVRSNGLIKWRGSLLFVGEAMRGESIGLRAIDEGLWHVYLGKLRLGALHERSRTVVPLVPSVVDECHPCARTGIRDQVNGKVTQQASEPLPG